MTVHVIIPATRWSQMLDRAVESARGSACVTVVLNGPATPDAAPVQETTRRQGHQLQIVQVAAPIGFAAACNLGFSRAVGSAPAPEDRVLFLNDDAQLPEGWVAALEWLQEPETGAVGFRVEGPKGERSRHAATPRAGAAGLGLVQHGPTLAGSAFAMRASTFLELGGLDETYRMYGEETDLFARLQRRGQLLIQDERHVWHQGEATMGRQNLRRAWLGVLSPLRYAFVNEPPLRLVRTLLATTAHLLLPPGALARTDPHVLRRRALPWLLRPLLGVAALAAITAELPRLLHRRFDKNRRGNLERHISASGR